MLATHVDRTYTYADLSSWPENEHWELYEGTPIAMSSPTVTHQRVQRNLLTFLSARLAASGGKCEVFGAPLDVLLPEPGQKESDVTTVIQPDLFIICDRSKLTKRAVIGAPDILTENDHVPLSAIEGITIPLSEIFTV